MDCIIQGIQKRREEKRREEKRREEKRREEKRREEKRGILGGLWKRLWEGSGRALGGLWEDSGRALGRLWGPGGSRGVWEGLSPLIGTALQPFAKVFFVVILRCVFEAPFTKYGKLQ